MARTYPVHEAKARLSELLRRVKAGGSVVISDRGKPIAKVVPIEPATDVESRLVELKRAGLLVHGRGSREAIRPIVRKPGGLKRFLESRE